jgi:hypothetical protein
MRLSAIAIAFASSLLLTTGAFADGTAAPAAPATTPTAAPTTGTATPAPDVDDTVTCRYEAAIGTNFKKRVCHTQREWKQMTTDSHDMMDRLNDHDRIGAPASN